MARLSLTFLRFSFLVVLALALFLMGGRPAPVHAAPFTVTRTDDPTPNGCNMNDCSLREAIIAANGVGGPLITLPAGTYTLSIPSTGEDAAADGDLDITDNVTITGAGAATTIIDGNSGVTGDKVFEVDPTSAGGIILEMSGVTVENGREAIGGGILNYGSLILTDSIVTGNVAEGVGGGLFNETGAGMSLTNVTVTGNGAAAWGGGIWSDGGLSISDSTISGNTANSTGGGVYNQSNGILAVIGSTVSANVATTTSGGGIYNTGTMGVIDSLVIGNSAASGSGGGIENDGLGVATVSNSTITGNNALSGGGVDNRAGLSLYDDTITANAASSGGGIWAFDAILLNTIVAGNPSGGDCFITVGTTSSHSLDGDNSCDLTDLTDLPATGPNLGPLADNGGPTPTYALLSGSPAIDAGNNAGCPAADQRGVSRPADGDLNGTAICDIGAYELERKTDITQYRSSNGIWYVRGLAKVKWGLSGDIPVPADYNGNGKANIAMYRPSDRKWYVRGQPPVQWGLPGDMPVPGDYDGDGATEIAQYRPSNRTWYVPGMAPVQWGLPGDVPVPADYNGDGKTQIGQYRPSNGTWYVPGMPNVSWGLSGDMPLPGDYNGNGMANIAVWRPSDGVWYVRGSSNVHWGQPGDVPVPKDYY